MLRRWLEKRSLTQGCGSESEFDLDSIDRHCDPEAVRYTDPEIREKEKGSLTFNFEFKKILNKYVLTIIFSLDSDPDEFGLS
jgi:hypothetical protein